MSSSRPRLYPEILEQMQATAVRRLGDEADLNEGSFLSTILEAAALQDAEQHVQIAKMRDLRNLFKLKGDDLDRFALEFGARYFPEMKRRPANTSISEVLVGDGTAQQLARLDANVTATATSFEADDASAFPTSGAAVLERGTEREEEIIYTRSGNVFTVVYPTSGVRFPHLESGRIETVAVKATLAASVSAGAASATITAGLESQFGASGTVIFERDTIRRESRTYTRVGTTLTLGAPLGFAHASGTDIIKSTFGSDRAVAAGSSCYVPETAASKRIPWRVKTAGTLLDGDFVSALIEVESESAGAATRVGSNQITKWTTEPFASATVTNPNAAVRGDDRENDDAYKLRLVNYLQSLSRGTALAIETLVGGKRDTFSELQCAFAQTVEPVAAGESLLYITDGTTTFGIDYQQKTGRDVLITDARVNDARARLNAYGPFKMTANPASERTPRIYKSEERGSATTTGVDYIEDTTQSWTVNEHIGKYAKTDDNQFYEITANTAIRLTVDAAGATPSLGSYCVFDFTADPLEPGVDYTFNQSNGDLELDTPLVAHDGLVAADDGASASVGAYTYSRGLAAYVQRLVNGDRTDFPNFPGIKALGTHCRVVAPTIITPTILIQVVTDVGFTDDTLRETVQTVIQSYINSLGIGQQVLLSEIIRLVKALAGVYDCRIISPTSNPNVPDGCIARINASDIGVV
jgi:uncharacterized phage protein gp47/JayE